MSAPNFATLYDEAMLDPSARVLYEHTGWYNVGDWSRGATSLPRACADLVLRHVAAARAACERAPRRILDAGCGLGDGSALVASELPEARVLGANLSATQLRLARARNPGCDWGRMDATRLAIADSALDWVLSVEAMFHFAPRRAFLEEALRVLRPGGVAVLSDLLFHSVEAIGDWWVPEANRGLRFEDYPALCRDVGFEVLRIEDVTGETWLAFCRYLRRFPGRIEAAERLEPALSHYLLAVLRRP
jgi:SAM-dependent methyltransferase